MSFTSKQQFSINFVKIVNREIGENERDNGKVVFSFYDHFCFPWKRLKWSGCEWIGSRKVWFNLKTPLLQKNYTFTLNLFTYPLKPFICTLNFFPLYAFLCSLGGGRWLVKKYNMKWVMGALGIVLSDPLIVVGP